MGKKIFWKFNIIDLLLIALLILSISALIYKMTWGSKNKEAQFNITYICEDAPLELLYGIKTGDKCADSDKGVELGTVSGCSVSPNPDNNGKGKVEIFTTVIGIRAEHGLSINNNMYLRGKSFPLIIGDSVFNVYISDIK